MGSPHYKATCTLKNTSLLDTLSFYDYNEGQYSDPTGGPTGTEAGKDLTHGKIVDLPNPLTIGPGESTTWMAQSDGSTVEGAVNFAINGDDKNTINCFFHVGRGGVNQNGTAQPDCTEFTPSSLGTASIPEANSDNNDYGNFSYTYTGSPKLP